MIVNVSEAKTNLSKLIDRAFMDEKVVISKNNLPLVDLVPHRRKGRRKLGTSGLSQRDQHRGNHDQGIVGKTGRCVLSSDFSPGTCREAERADAVPVALMNGGQLVLLLSEHEVGVTRRSHAMLDLAETNLNRGKGDGGHAFQ